MVPQEGFEPSPLQGLNLMSLPVGRLRDKKEVIGYQPIADLQQIHTSKYPTIYSQEIVEPVDLSTYLSTRSNLLVVTTSEFLGKRYLIVYLIGTSGGT